VRRRMPGGQPMESQQAQSQPVQQQPRAPGRRWGITLPLQGSPLAAQREMVAALPALGYTDAWSAEVSGVDAFTPLALASQWTSELRFGTAITSVYTRAPGVLAMSAATIADLAPGRFVLGIGTSSQIVVEQWNGIPFEKPYHRAADMLRFLRAALAGQRVSEQYETFAVDGFRLEQAPAVPPGLALAALRPQMLRLAAAAAKGAIAAIPDQVVDDLVVHGQLAACREGVAKYQAAGLDTPVIVIIPVPGLDVAGAGRKLAPA